MVKGFTTLKVKLPLQERHLRVGQVQEDTQGNGGKDERKSTTY